jgi:hypothetical protein
MSKQHNGHSTITLPYQTECCNFEINNGNGKLQYCSLDKQTQTKCYTINQPNHMPVSFGVCMWQHVSMLAEGPQRDMSSEKTKMLPTGSRDRAQRYVKQLRAKNKCIWLEHCSFAHSNLQTRIDFIRGHCLCAKTWGLLQNREWYKIIM